MLELACCVSNPKRAFKMYRRTLFIFFVMIPMAKSARPGTFFWRPRLSLDLAIPTTKSPFGMVRSPDKAHIYGGLVTLVDGYAAGITVIGMASGITSATAYPHLDPTGPYFYTNVYRWALRYLALIPAWAGGGSGNFVDTHRTWRRRYYYMDEFMPGWLKKTLFFIPKEAWEQEVTEWKRFKKYSEHAFGKHYKFPTKHFNNFKSMITEETAEVNYEEVSSEAI